MEEQKSYEFDESQNQVIGELSKKMNFVGIILIVLAILMMLGGIFSIAKGGLANLGQGIVSLIIGIWTMKASKAFKLIVDTTGNDIKNLMEALSELKNLYALQFWLYILAFIFIVVVLVLAVVLAGAGAMMHR